MFSMLKRGSAIAVLLIATVAWGCETSTEPIPETQILEVESSDQFLGGLLGTIGDILRSAPRLVGTVVHIVGDLGSAIIGPVGGILQVDDHSISIPAGAVSQPAEFSMQVADGYRIEVDLRAIDPETGEDVGGKGFNRPVQLALSYEDARISSWDARKLVIVRVLDDGTRVPLPSTVNTWTKTVTAELDHFSRYMLCRN